nr:hypothetical protein BaRGS_022219 [Batillaria attramentaria]
MMTEIVKECNTAYSVFDQEEDDFDIGWKQRTVNSTVNSTAEWYKYVFQYYCYMSADELDSYPYWGQLAVYGGGGYVVRLQGSRSDLLDLMARLETEMWVDRYTRAVFIEFTTYNAQVNLFSIARILAEFHPTGGIVPSYRFEPAMLLPYGASVYYTHLTLEILLCCFILFLTIRLMAGLAKQRMAFLRGFWNIIELCIITMSWSAVVVYFFRLFETQKRTAEVKETQGLGYVSFQYVAYWHEVLGYLVGWAVFFATVKFLKLLRFNRRISLFAATLKECSGALLNFSLVFWVVFLSFDMLFFLIYMTIDGRYSSFMGSAVANTLMIMGKFTTYDMMMADPLLTTVLMFLYCFSMTYILLSVFVAILSDGFKKVRDNLTKQQNDHEILNFIICRIRHFFGAQIEEGPSAVDRSEPDAGEQASKTDAAAEIHTQNTKDVGCVQA